MDISALNKCALCNNLTVRTLIDFGPQPISNRFLASPDAKEFRHPLVLGYCPSCDLAQLVNPVSAKELLPPYDWISYNEPEKHLDELVSILAALPGIAPSSTIGGISFKDDTTLRRFENLGFRLRWRIDQAADLGITMSSAGVETIQERLSPSTAERTGHSHGRAEILVVRHILEHSHDVKSFVKSLKTLASPDGYIVIEVPDCSRSFTNQDFTTLWEEHRLYFTPDSFRRFFEVSGFTVVKFLSYPYAFENSLVAIVKTNGAPQRNGLHSQEKMMHAYAAAYFRVRGRIRSFLDEFTNRQGPIALFGAGHLACTYVNLLEIGGHVKFIVDDNPYKQGLFMPGSRLPVVGSQALLEQGIRLCLLSLSPEIEDRVIERNKAFVDSGGIFVSIFPDSKYALRIP